MLPGFGLPLDLLPMYVLIFFLFCLGALPSSTSGPLNWKPGL